MDNKISIIIPAYNIQNEVERCIRSVLDQTYKNIEIIIVNDGSTDNTLEILRKMETTDSRIHVIDKANEGVTVARLTGVRAASGEWIGFVDGDDYIEPDMYEHLLKNAIKYNADISHCGYQMVFPSRVNYYYNSGVLIEQNNQQGLYDILEGSKIEPGLWNKLYKKKVLDALLDNKYMDTSIKNTEDLLMNFYLFRESNKSVYEDFCPYHYLVRETSAANRSINEHQLLDPIKVLDYIVQETKDNVGLNILVQKHLIRMLIVRVTMNSKANEELIDPIKKMSKNRLKKNFWKILLSKNYPIRLKIMTVIAVFVPGFYNRIHGFYEHIKGIDKLYEIS